MCAGKIFKMSQTDSQVALIGPFSPHESFLRQQLESFQVHFKPK